jgi:hypothetical protein
MTFSCTATPIYKAARFRVKVLIQGIGEFFIEIFRGEKNRIEQGRMDGRARQEMASPDCHVAIIQDSNYTSVSKHSEVQ